jgi:predicted RNase H-like nuclease (RuvC/YqgF family)
MPVLNKVHSQKSELEKLQQALAQARSDVERKNQKNRILREDLDRQKQVNEALTKAAEEAIEKGARAIAECERLQKEVDGKDTEIKHMKAKLQSWAKDVRPFQKICSTGLDY